MKKTNETVEEIRTHSRRLVRELDVVKGGYLDSGYTFSQCHVLFELATHGSLGLMEIASNLLIDKSNTSRTVKRLVDLGLVKTKTVAADKRQKKFSLTAKGRKVLNQTVGLASEQTQGALQNLNVTQQQQVIDGLKLYADALRKSRKQADYQIRPIRKQDNAQVAQVIREVMMEFAAVGEGYSIGDVEVDDMFGNYRDNQSCYYVIAIGSSVVGCGGFGPLHGGGKSTCELRKMFFKPEIRGIGLGYRLLSLLMDEAKNRGYKKCYLETLNRMDRASELYLKNGFKLLDGPKGKTGHCACDCWYMREL